MPSSCLSINPDLSESKVLKACLIPFRAMLNTSSLILRCLFINYSKIIIDQMGWGYWLKQSQSLLTFLQKTVFLFPKKTSRPIQTEARKNQPSNIDIINKYSTIAMQVEQESQTRSLAELKHSIERVQLLQGLKEVQSKIDSLVKVIMQQQGLQWYFQKANVTKAELLINIHTIQTSFLDMADHIKTLEEINPKSLRHVISFIDDYLGRKMLNNLTTEQLAVWIVEFECLFLPVLNLLQTAITAVDDITQELPDKENSPFWKGVRFDPFADPKKLQASFQGLAKMTTLIAAAVLASEKRNSTIMKKITFGTSFSKYMVKYNEARLISAGFYRNPDVRIATAMWNTLEMGLIKEMSKITFEKIAVNQKIYIPFEETEFRPDIYRRESENSIQVRLLSSKPVKFYHKRVGGMQCYECVNNSEKDTEMDTIIVHMHGGGFIAMSSGSMQIYTRRWANSLGIPVFSIDYRMPPNHPFPQAPMDVLRVYTFLLKHISYYMNIRPKHIILSGDSAGGSLACSLMGQILKNNLPIPKGIFLAYPSMDIRRKYTHSMFYALSDALLKPSILYLCLSEYIGSDESKQTDPLASPILLSQEYVNGEESKGDKRYPVKWPRTVIYCGDKDPLLDDSKRLAHKLYENKTPCEFTIYENFSHGFFNIGFIVPECEKIILDSIRSLKGMLAAIEPEQAEEIKPVSELSKDVSQALIRKDKEPER